MGRYSSAKSYRQSCQKLCPDCYRLTWYVDRYYPSSRLRFPTRYQRDTDLKGAQRFCKRWGFQIPDEAPNLHD